MAGLEDNTSGGVTVRCPSHSKPNICKETCLMSVVWILQVYSLCKGILETLNGNQNYWAIYPHRQKECHY